MYEGINRRRLFSREGGGLALILSLCEGGLKLIFAYNERGYDLVLGHISPISQPPPLQIIIAQSLLNINFFCFFLYELL